VAAEGPWRDRLADARDPSPVKPLEFYYDCLARKSRRIVLWETNYIQIMDGIEAIIAWLHGTGLRPFLARLTPWEQPVFPRSLQGAAGRRLPAPRRRQAAAPLPSPVLPPRRDHCGANRS